MNELTLKKKSNLIMPAHYVEIDNDEMSYVEGGYKMITNHILWWDVTLGISLNPAECADLAAICSGAVALSLLIPEPTVSKVLTVLSGVCSAFFWLASNHNGLDIYWGGIAIIKW